MKKTNFCYAVLAASAVLALGASITSFAAGWEEQNGEWVYVDNSGNNVTDTWKQDDGKYYYLGSDGYMVRSTLIEDNDSYYYVNSSGAMVTNAWKYLENPSWQGDELAGETSWYYFGSNGRAQRTSGDKVQITTIGDKKYAFDSYGRMMTGWVTESGSYIDEDEWADATYYANGEDNGGDGSIVTNAWLYISVTDNDNEDDTEPTYHFYFGSNGKKIVSTTKTIGTEKYEFDERGVACSAWVQDDTGWRYYGDSDEPHLHTGWFEATPDEDLYYDGYSDGSTYWYYASSKGYITMGEFKTINSKTYGFNSRGELITGLKKVTVSEEDNKTITAYSDIDYVSDITGMGDNQYLIYFTSDGSIKTGTTTYTIDGTTCNLSFSSSGSPKGAGITKIESNYIYVNGLRLCADDGTKYQVVSYNDKSYVVNESGTIQKNKKNIKNSDGYYFCTDKNGVLLHGPLAEKCTETTHTTAE